jgi:class 3 adenylate cyclase
MLRQLVGNESPLACEGPRPAVRLGLHWGPVLVTAPAHETPLQVLAVGETLAIPVRLSGQAALGEVLASAAMD